jgi:acetate kinase
MGFTTLDGLTMGTRPGQIDPGVILHLQTAKGMSVADVQNFIYRECGLKGMSGISNDMRDLVTSDDPHAILAVEHFVHRAALNGAMLVGALQGLDALVFTAGIGENSSHIRARIADKLGWLGVTIDPDENARHATKISAPNSRIPTYVVPSDEEKMIARHTVAVLAKTRGSVAHTIPGRRT